MKPVDQEYLSGNDKNIPGDCVRACVASILELPREKVPHFVQIGDTWWLHEFEDWLIERRIALMVLSHQTFEFPTIVVGDSPRDPQKISHAVIEQSGKIIHDPHPSRDGLYGKPKKTYLFLPIDINWQDYLK